MQKWFLSLLIFVLWCQVAPAQPYPIGTQTITWQDPARNNRNVQTYLYYPGVTAGSNAAVASGSFPVVVIGHGFTMSYSPYTYLADTLVPKGYIVAIPNTETGFSPSHSEFAADLAFVVSKLYSENANSGSSFYQHVTLKSCIAGHSMGGGCTMLAAANNPNATCTVTMALAETNPSAISAATSVTVPSLVLSGSDDCVTPAASNQTPAYNNLPGCKSHIIITDGGHCNFGTSNFNCNFGEMTCNPGGPALPAATQRALTCRFLTPWLDRFLKSDGNAGILFNSRFNTSVASGAITGSVQCLVLPLELLEFSGKATDKQIELFWKTANELNIRHFTVEKSMDGIEFVREKTIEPGLTNYRWIDENPSSGWQFYRLRIEESDGLTTYSPVVAVQFHSAGMIIWPNPAADEVVIQAKQTQAAPIQIFDALGRMMFSYEPTEHDNMPLRVNVASWPAGLYRVFCTNQSVILIRK